MSYIFVLFINNFIKPGAGGGLVCNAPRHTIVYGTIMAHQLGLIIFGFVCWFNYLFGFMCSPSLLGGLLC